MAGSEIVPASITQNECPNSSATPLVKDGPVLSFMGKRLRALRKKYNRILQIEESKAQGKVINKEQEDVLKSKASISVLIEEYERLRQPLCAAVKEERAEIEKELKEAKEIKSEANGSRNGSREVQNGGLESQTSSESLQNEVSHVQSTGISDDEIAELLKVLYFANLFDVSSQNDFPSIMWTRMHERSSCLSYDYVTDDATKPLREEDLDALSMLGSMLTSRPANATLSHQDALNNCVQHARRWLSNSDQQIHPDSAVSYSDIKERLNRILSSDYYTMTPELQTVTQEAAVAAANAAGYVTQILVHEHVAEGSQLQPDAAPMYFSLPDQSTDNQHVMHQAEHVSPVDATDQLESAREDNSATEHMSETAASYEAQEDTIQINTDSGSTEQKPVSPPAEFKERPVDESHDQPELENNNNFRHTDYSRREQHQQQQYYSQNGGMNRGYQNQRGGRGMGYGGRGRGYTNGRGRGRGPSYSNGRGPYYDQGNYYSRNYTSGRGRGRRNEAFYNNNAPPSQKSAIAAST